MAAASMARSMTLALDASLPAQDLFSEVRAFQVVHGIPRCRRPIRRVQSSDPHVISWAPRREEEDAESGRLNPVLDEAASPFTQGQHPMLRSPHGPSLIIRRGTRCLRVAPQPMAGRNGFRTAVQMLPLLGSRVHHGIADFRIDRLRTVGTSKCNRHQVAPLIVTAYYTSADGGVR
jgi:hypothetical protein